MPTNRNLKPMYVSRHDQSCNTPVMRKVLNRISRDEIPVVRYFMSNSAAGGTRVSRATRRRFLKYAIAGIAVVAAGTGVYEYVNSLQASTKVNLGFFSSAASSMVSNAMQTQNYAKDFKFDVSWATLTDQATATNSLAKGSLDVYYGGNIGSLAAAKAGDLPIQIVFGSARASNTIMVAKDSPYNSVADLKGKKVGSPFNPPLAFHVSIFGLKNKGVAINYDDLTYSNSPPNVLPSLLDSHQVEAIEIISPILENLNASGKYRVLSVARDEWSAMGNGVLYGAVIAANSSFGDSHPNAVTSAIQMWVNAVKYISNNSNIIADYATNTLKRCPQVVDSYVQGQRSQIQLAAWDDAAIAGLNKLIEMFQSTGILTKKPENLFTKVYANNVRL